MKKRSKKTQKHLKGIKKLQNSLMSNDSQSSFFNEGLDTPDDGLSIEVAIETFIEASLEVEEEQHHFTGL